MPQGTNSGHPVDKRHYNVWHVEQNLIKLTVVTRKTSRLGRTSRCINTHRNK